VSGSAQDADALVATLFTQEADRLVALARFFTDDRTAAEDLVQEAFIRLARNTGRIRDTDKAAAYLRSIVVNLSRDHNRRGLVSLRHRPPAVLDAEVVRVRRRRRPAPPPGPVDGRIRKPLRHGVIVSPWSWPW